MKTPDLTLLPGIRRGQHRFAGSRQRGHRHAVRGRFRRLFRWRRMDDRILEPVGEIGLAAAFAAALIRLSLAFAGAGRALHADVEVVVMAPPWPDLGKPAAIAGGLAAQRLLD